MSFEDKINQIESLQQAIQKRGKLTDDVLKKTNYKFRLEWNYHSNRMEGGSLTRQETRTVMIGNITVNGKPIKDVMDMKGHDDVIVSIIKMGKGELNISEKRIKDIHAAVLYEEDPEKKKQMGKWKVQPNYLYNYKNERVDFAAPADVPDAMHKLVNWVNVQKEKIERKDKDALHPLQLAFRFHLDYISIHPFYDGNGRTARIFTNLILIAYGYPPIYIKTEEKNIYYQYLADIQAYGDAPDLFFTFMGDLLVRSQQMILNAIDGKNIDEPDDLDKKLYLLNQDLPPLTLEEASPGYSIGTMLFKEMVYKYWLSDLLRDAITVIQKFNGFFAGSRHFVDIDGIRLSFSTENPDVVVRLLEGRLVNEVIVNNHEIKVVLTADYAGFNREGATAFDCKCSMEVWFQHQRYELRVPSIDKQSDKYTILFEKPLSELLTAAEIQIAVQALGNTIFNHIDHNSRRKQ